MHNETLEQLKRRKSIRAFEKRPIEPEVKREILTAALEAPTAGNMMLYSIIDVTDENVKKELSITCDNQPFIATAPMVAIFLADYRRWIEAFDLYGAAERRPGEGEWMLAVADALIAAQNTVVAAEALGVGSCYIGDIMERYERHRELLNLPDYVFPAAMLVYGYPTQQQLDRKKPSRSPLSEVLHENRYQDLDAQENILRLARREGKPVEEMEQWLKAFAKRKYNADFSIEMTRSVKEIIREFTAQIRT